MLNVVALVGRMTADPELRHTQSDVAVATFTIAVDRSYVRQGEERKTDFIKVVAWRHTADFVAKYFQKGSMIAVEGQLQSRKYEDKQGNNRTAVEVSATACHFVGPKNSESKADKGHAEPAVPGNPQEEFAYLDDSDLPFE